ncbi:MAG: Tfp pilus assembly protein PilX [Chlamydiales bacterium]|jgi:Tfp pilus assembly protein PilX
MILHRHSGATSSQRGSVLAISLIVVMVIASLGAGLIQMHSAIARRQLQAIDNKRALYIAEAGLSEAFMAIAHGKSGAIGSEERPAIFGNGLFWVEVAEQPDQSIAIVSNGLCETGRFSLAMTVERQISPIASLGLFGAQAVTIGQGAIIDGYDSQVGTYDAQVDPDLAQASTGQGARITSNAEIEISATAAGSSKLSGDGLVGLASEEGADYSTWIYGDAIPGPDGGVLADPGVLITGDTVPALKPVRLERLDVPIGLAGSTALVHTDATPLVLSNVEAQYRKVYVGPGSELVLQGPVTIMATGILLDPGAKLTIDTTGGPVMIYATAYVSFAEGSILANSSQDPTQVALVVGASEDVDIDGDGTLDPAIHLAAEGDFYGMLYAPRSDVSVPSTLRMFGCVTGDSLTFEDGSHFSYDIAMKTTGVAVTGLPGLLSWRIVSLPDADIVKHRTDPMRALKLAGVTPTPSSEAYAETYIRLDYTDGSGNPQTYEGLETSLDWNQVQKVDNMRWSETLAGLNTAPDSGATGKTAPAIVAF